ncbi:MAG TPA: pyridoxal phosphate-dependent aminotransferase family protein [Cytophagaceae bacterium]|jgi:8-amino-7-oxononanoate synthase|nr:pyridoxal phosphate-dependent aminotransferase family protein [Cytophagaceae bacterium]
MDKLRKKLSGRELNGNLRRLTLNDHLIDFYSNDYLGLARSQDLSENINQEYSCQYGNMNGSTGSRLLSGNSEYCVELEEYLAQLFKAESALLFNSGYNANLSILSAIPQKNDTIIYDELIHTSLKDGARLSFAKRFSFSHNDLVDLEAKIQKGSGEIFVVIESVYSMDGDSAPLKEIIALCEKYKAALIVDEAHSTGIWGEKGNGLLCKLGIEQRVFARIHTFGKAMGVHGACICGSKDLIDFLINFARPFIYTTALPLHALISIKQSFEYLDKNISLQEISRKNISLFKSGFKNPEGKLIESESPIQAIKIGGNEQTKNMAESIRGKRFDVRPILSPTVKEGEERLRICLHTYNTSEEIRGLTELINMLTSKLIHHD